LTLDNEVSHSTSVEVRDVDELVKRLLSDDLIDVGEVKITRTNFRDGSRYLVYLPMARNYLWEALHSSKCKVRLFMQVVTREQRRQLLGCSRNEQTSDL
jgi:hypothetical protein